MSILGSISAFFGDVETAAKKVAGFIVSEMVSAENLLGAKTGNAKLNLVVAGVEAALGAFGIDVKNVESELTTVVNALVALFNKAGIFTTTPPSAT